MAPTFRPPGPIGSGGIGRGVAFDQAFSTTAGIDTTGVPRGPQGRSDPPVAGREPVSPELRELALDLVQLSLDLAGIVDPTPISDGSGALLALARGLWLDSAISGVSMVPYVGDLAKTGKLPRYLRSVGRAVELVERSGTAAHQLIPGLRRIDELLALIPVGANATIDLMRGRVREALQRSSLPAGVVASRRLPDISRQFRFPETYSVRVADKTYQVQEASGRLGVPGLVRRHRDRAAQSSVSSGSGDHAGHLIGDQFGAPGDARNLSRQNWIMNSGGGTFHDLERRWQAKLTSGSGIEVRVRDFIPEGSQRPAFRKVEWTEIATDGRRSHHRLDFANTHSADWTTRSGRTVPGSRTQQGIEPTVNSPQTDNVIEVDFRNRRRK